MPITRLEISGLRNLKQVSLTPCPSINLLFGQNGSGKTSALEAVHLLGLARSFRTSTIKPLVSHHLEKYTVFCDLAGEPPRKIGLSKTRDGQTIMRIDGANIKAASELAQTLPLLLINQDSFLLLEGPPKQRRQFIDWGVFHVEPSFLPNWRRAQRALKQRNQCLRRGMIRAIEIGPWEQELANAAEQLDTLRRTYVNQLKEVFAQVAPRWPGLEDIQLDYFAGWNTEAPLLELLEREREKDVRVGFTQHGPHKADLRIKTGRFMASDILSRGQQKLVVSALKVAQSRILNARSPTKAIVLADDVAAELDGDNLQVLCDLLAELESQVFVTCVNRQQLECCWSKAKSVKTFHVEQGNISPVN